MGGRGHVKDLIVRFLAVNKNQRANQILFALKEKKLNCTIQALYAELRKLQAQGVIVKGNRLYNLSLPWVMETLNFTEKMYATYSSAPFPTGFLPKKSKKSFWQFSNLEKLDDFTVQIMLALLHTTEDKQFFSWTRHPWFLLVHPEKELRFEKTLKQLKKKQCLFIEGTASMDLTLSKKYDRNVIMRKTGVPFTGWRKFGSFIAIIGEYLVYQDLRGKTDLSIDQIFQMNRERDSGDSPEQYKNLIGIINGNTSSRVVVESSASNILKIRKQFERVYRDYSTH